MFRSIVVPVDLAEPEIAHQAIIQAAAFAKMADGKVTLVNVVQIAPFMMLETVPVSYEVDIASKAKAALADLSKTIDLPAGRVKAEVRIGGIYHEVLEVAKNEAADLIVVGSHRPAMATYLIGSNATAIVRHATCSVLVVRT